MTEAQLQAAIIDHAHRLGWTVMHIGDSRREVRAKSGVSRLVGDALTQGWPDLVLVRRGHILIRELKSARGRVTREQAMWLQELAGCGLDVGVWRPKDWPDTVHAELAGNQRSRR